MRRAAFLLLVVLCATSASAAVQRTIATANAATCDIGTYPAATLLLPVFEVDFNAPATQAVNTIFSVVNTSKTPQIVRVTIWTDWGFPAAWFPMFLTGYDMHTVSMYDIFARGNFPFTVSTGMPGSSSLPNTANPHFDVNSMCANFGGSIGPDRAHRLQRIFTTGQRDDPSCRVGGVHDHAIGYVTIDVVNSCALDPPTSETYWKQIILFDNVLTGDYERINPNETTGNYAGGNPLVHIRAVPEGGAAGSRITATLPYTFYDRLTPRDARGIDRRQPLPTAFAAHVINGGPTGFRTNFVIWREGVVGPSMNECDYAANGKMPLFTPMVVRFDENENAATATGCGQEGCSYPTLGAATVVDSESALFPPSPNGDVGGWIWMNLDNGAGARGGGPYSTRRSSQSWVVIQMYAEGRYGVDFDATSIVNGCTASPPTQP